MYDNILVPTDGSGTAADAIDHAIELASTYDATVHALYVVDTAAYGSIEVGADVFVDALEQEGNDAVEEVAEKGDAAGVTVEGVVEHGSPAHTIVEYADDHDVDLIVMGTHGRRGIDRVILGSVAGRVVRVADVPVMVVPMEKSKDE